MAIAARLPPPMASITVAGPVTASPAAKMPGRLVSMVMVLTRMVSRWVQVSPGMCANHCCFDPLADGA